jgi:hypothetical protein
MECDAKHVQAEAAQ